MVDKKQAKKAQTNLIQNQTTWKTNPYGNSIAANEMTGNKIQQKWKQNAMTQNRPPKPN
jgi:hypothetical protein